MKKLLAISYLPLEKAAISYWLLAVGRELKAKSQKLIACENWLLEAAELIRGDACLSDYCPQGALRDVFAGVIGYYRPSMGSRIIPDFMASLGMAVEDKASLAQFAYDFNGFQGRQAAHISNGTGISVLNLPEAECLDINALGMGSLCSISDSRSFLATSSAISMVSAMVRPWAMSPCRAGLVAKYSPSSKGSIDIGIKYSDISFTSFEVYHKSGIMSRAIKQPCTRIEGLEAPTGSPSETAPTGSPSETAPTGSCGALGDYTIKGGVV